MIVLTNAAFRRILVVASLATVACDHSTGLPGIVTGPQSGFIDFSGCGTVVESVSGGIYTFDKVDTPAPLKVDSRSADGSIDWSIGLPSGFGNCTAAVGPSGNLLFATTDTLYSLKTQNGAVRWRIPAGNSGQIATSSTGMLFVWRSGVVYALSDNDGSVRWSRTVNTPGAVGLFVDDARSNLYAVRDKGAVAMDLATGTVKWETTQGQDYGADAAIAADGSLVIAKSNTAPGASSIHGPYTGAIESFGSDGVLRWRDTLGLRPPDGSPVIDDAGTVYLAAGAEVFPQYGAGVYAFSMATGEMKWKHEFLRIHSNIAVDADRTVYVIAQAAADSAYQLYGLRDGITVSAVRPVSDDYPVAMTIHSNKRLYYKTPSRIAFISTAGASPNAAWPVDKHDAKRSARR